MVHEIENFYGVYLLKNVNPLYSGKTYIGYTVDPNRRIKQHNLGIHAGGAYKTSGKGPWEMVLIIHGFPNDISGLRFEWAWQNPEKSRRLKHLAKKSKKESQFDFKFRVVSEMLRTSPWNRLSLTIRWLKQEYSKEFSPDLAPPLHMAIAYGPAKSIKVKAASVDKHKEETNPEDTMELDAAKVRRYIRCTICNKLITPMVEKQVTVGCYHPKCTMTSHIICLANSFLTAKKEEMAQILPVEGVCPKCKQALFWGDIVRHKHGCYQNLSLGNSCDSNENHWANELQSQVT